MAFNKASEYDEHDQEAELDFHNQPWGCKHDLDVCRGFRDDRESNGAGTDFDNAL